MHKKAQKYLVVGIVLVVLAFVFMYVSPSINPSYIMEDRPIESLNPLLAQLAYLCPWVCLPIGSALIAASFVIREVLSYLEHKSPVTSGS